VTCFEGEFVLNRGIANDFIKRQEIFAFFGHIAKLTVKGGPGGVGYTKALNREPP
jgi:hypothetical protein